MAVPDQCEDRLGVRIGGGVSGVAEHWGAALERTGKREQQRLSRLAVDDAVLTARIRRPNRAIGIW